MGPKRHILVQKHVVRCTDRQNRSTGVICVRDKDIKKTGTKKETLLKVFLPRPHSSSDQDEILQ